MGRKLALIIGNSRYDDPGLARLAATDVDVREIAGVLRTPDIGQFDEVVELPDEGLAVVRRSIAKFFSQATKDDLLVFYFSGHGVKDENGQLYLAVRDTERHLLTGTSIEAAYITAQMDRSHSKRQVLILDCCHSGAFAYGAKSGDAQLVGTASAFEGTGYGRVVLTATDSTQYAWEGDQVIGSDKSVFTHYLLEGLKTGEADRDGDGLITIDELYEYVYEHVVTETPKQTPGKWSYKQQGEIVLARNLRPLARVPELPPDVRALLESPLLRLRAVPELAALLLGQHRGLALAARKALEELRGDDSRRVSTAAERILSTLVEQEEAQAAAAREAERVRREADQLVAEASERLMRQDVSGALAQVDAARQLDPSNSAAAALRDRIQRASEEARRREELEREARERRQRVAALIGSAGLKASPQAAIEVLNEALALDPGNAEAMELLARHTAALEHAAAERARQQEIAAARRRIEDLLQRDELNEAEQAIAQAEKTSGDLSGFDELRRRLQHKQHDRRASEVVEGARREFAAGLHEQAVAALERFRPPHPLVSRALGDLTTDLERLRRQDEERRRREAEQRAREQEVVSLRDAARSHIERQQFVEALRALRRAQQLDPDAAGLTELVDAAEAGRVAVEETERRRREAQDVLTNASKRFRRHDLTRALALAEEACRLDPQNPAGFELRGDIQQALNERAAAVDSTGSAQQSSVSIRSVLSFLQVSRPLHVGLVVVLLASGLALFSLREAPPPENSGSPPEQPSPAVVAPPAPAPATSSLPSGTVPAVVPPSVPAPAKPGARGGAVQSNRPAGTDESRTSRGSSQPAPPAQAPSDVEPQIARSLAEGDRLLEARNYDGAQLAYQEASRLGSAVGRERAEKAGQEKSAQVRLRLNRAERLQDTGDYEEALRAIDEALTLDPKSVEGRSLRQRVLDAQSFERALRR